MIPVVGGVDSCFGDDFGVETTASEETEDDTAVELQLESSSCCLSPLS